MSDEFQTEATEPMAVLRRIVIFVAVVAVAALIYWYVTKPKNNSKQIEAAIAALRKQEYDQALELVDEALEIEPGSEMALLLGADTARRKNDFKMAEDYLKRIPEDSPEYLSALLGRGHVNVEMGNSLEAETMYRAALELEPDNEEGITALAFLLRIQGRNWELASVVEPLIRSERINRDLLYPLAGPDKPWVDQKEQEFVAHCLKEFPDDHRPELGRIRQAMTAGQMEGMQPLLESIITTHPEDIESRLLYGVLVVQAGSTSEFLDWNSKLDQRFEEHPETWFLRGVWCDQNSQSEQAARCYWESLRRDPHHRRAHYRLVQVLKTLGEDETAARFNERFELLDELGRFMLYGDGSPDFLNPKSICRVANIMVELGRLPEAKAWCRYIKTLPRGTECADPLLEQIEPLISTETPLTAPESRLAGQIDLSRYPLPDWTKAADESAKQPAPDAQSQRVLPAVEFHDVAAEAGLSFQFIQGTEHAGRMFAFSGGGAGVVDFDHDDWPDLYLTQGNTTWPNPTSNPSETDRLFRNLAGRRFLDVTQAAGLAEFGFGQGVSVGDFNQDGFADLWVCNLGLNHLLQNNGDGTYSDATPEAAMNDAAWTASGVLADLNNDSWPDLYCVNYLSSADAVTRVCSTQGLPSQCPVNYFPAATDRLYLSRGDGTFDDVTDGSGIGTLAGKGMGIVAARMDSSAALSLFVANDTTPNFLLRPEQTSDGSWTWRDTASLSGVALSGHGEPQSCMGVAAGDLDGDHRLDLFVTNFILEPNNLYLQKSALLFEDQTGQRELRQASSPVMGWGVQFVDADRDGRLDVVVANGHLDRNTSGTAPYEMPTQYLHNLGQGQLVEHPTAITGPYGSRNHAGRAVARLDWNRDGRDDLVVTHHDEPVALLENRTSGSGQSLQLLLAAVTTSRDAIGTIVDVEHGGQTQTRQLTAGDGFQASNERVLTVGLGNERQADRVVIRWPSGSQQVLENLPADSRWMVVENSLARRL